ncbi:probable receptor-like protein kinase At1g33260 [Punica granatum]|uniref:Protein kinase domain-containing protein n=2 Tax=Punica granatum TaxID=22663 RepID=A0A218VXX0_PUNGR|nr:probable receptor-like protein kinase At1g33260 [Punica granatum]OWM65058.1 hypothetical protein CDL15_Pgr028776 [Punica granatum]PKI76527.1 hypothetical protein CRG98_003078 [Punica granatum]
MRRFLRYLRSKLAARCGMSTRGDAADNDCESCSGRGCELSLQLVKRYSWADIEALTENFATVIGCGGFSTVYLGRLSGGVGPAARLAAVKVHYGSERIHLAFKQELDILLRLHHENIVGFLGYCDDPESGALVFEYVSNGNLQEKLHSQHPALPWRARIRIAFQLAQALEYLHEKCALHVVHGDLKSSNILLDDALNCQLCDFGFAKLGFSSMVLPSPRSKHVMMGSPGYVDPQYLRTGVASKKNDMYSFGVIVLEMVMGMEAFCTDRGQVLAAIAAPVLEDLARRTAEEVMEMVDPKLSGEFDVEEAREMLSIAKLCLNQSPVLRPSAGRVLQIMNEKISSSVALCRSSPECLGKTPSNMAIYCPK